MHTNKFKYFRIISLDRYVLQEVVGTFVGACIFILFVLLMFQTLRLAEFFIVHGVPLSILGRMAVFLLISFLPTTLPLAFLISVLSGFSRLSSDSELIAMKSNGMSIYRMTVPVLAFASVTMIVAIFLNIDWVPSSETAFKRAEAKVGSSKVVSAIKEGTFTSGFFDLLIFADRVDQENNRLHRVFIYDEREPKNPLTYISRDAEIVPLKTATETSSAIMLRLFNGSMHHNDLDSNTYEKMDFDVYHLYLSFEEALGQAMQKPHMIPQKLLLEKIKQYDISTYEGREYRGEYWRRYATAMSPLFFVFLGIGFGSFRYRNARTGAILTGLIILLIYWTMQTFGTAAVLKGSLSPFMAMQMPNLVLSIIGIFAYRKAAW